jgi:hypothetical protein
MIQTINVSDFRAAFHSMGRQDQFSYEGLGALFDYLEDFDGGGYDLDVVALCCEYSEDTAEDIAANYNIEVDSIDELEDAVRAYLDENTTIVAETASGFLYAQF